MQITMTLDTQDADAVAEAFSVLSNLSGKATPASKPATKPADDKPKAPTATEKKATAAAAKKKEEEDAAAAEAEAAAAAAPEAEAEAASEFSRDDVRDKLKEHAALEGKDAAIQILKDNGAASITELAEDKFAAVIEACG